MNTEETQLGSLAAYAMLTAIGVLWGLSFVLMKIGVVSIPPATLVALRLIMAGSFLWCFSAFAGQKLIPFGKPWFFIAAAAFMGNALPFMLITWGQEKVDAGLAAILMGTVPLFAIFIAHFVTDDEKLTWQKIVGICLGLAGIIALFGPSLLGEIGDDITRQAAIAFSAFCYGITVNISKKLSGLPRRALAASIVLCAAVMAVPMALIIDRPWMIEPSVSSLLAVAALAVLCTAIPQIFLLRLVRERGVAFLTLSNYMIPVFGVMWGALIFAERPAISTVIALLFILAGIAVTQYRRRPQAV